MTLSEIALDLAQEIPRINTPYNLKQSIHKLLWNGKSVCSSTISYVWVRLDFNGEDDLLIKSIYESDDEVDLGHHHGPYLEEPGRKGRYYYPHFNILREEAENSGFKEILMDYEDSVWEWALQNGLWIGDAALIKFNMGYRRTGGYYDEGDVEIEKDYSILVTATNESNPVDMWNLIGYFTSRNKDGLLI